MSDEKYASLIKGMRILPFVFVLVYLVAGFFAAFYQSENQIEKWGTLAFLLFGSLALLSGVIGHCLYALLWKAGENGKKEDPDELLEDQ